MNQTHEYIKLSARVENALLIKQDEGHGQMWAIVQKGRVRSRLKSQN